MPDLKITVLVEDTVNKRELCAQHGLAFWVEWGDKKILFDTGPGEIILDNAKQLGIDLKTADAIVLSHGHYDHMGGLPHLLKIMPGIKIYAHPAAFTAKYTRRPNGKVVYAGVENLTVEKISQAAELIYVEGPTEICNGFYITGPVPRKTDFEDVGGPFFINSACTIPDDLPDDQSAYITTNNGTVVILGCAHAGVINTLQYIQQLTNGEKIHTLIGGMHLVNADNTRINKTIDELRKIGIENYLPCHCTGVKGVSKLWQNFEDKCTAAPVGTVL